MEAVMRVKGIVYIAILILATAAASLARDHKPQSRWATLDGNKIHYYDVGKTKSKEAIVLIHGWTCNADFWHANYEGLTAHRVLVVDLPGHGQSDKPKLTYSMEHFAKAVNAVMKQAGARRAVLVGHSMGTPVARQFYRLYPDQTLGIVVVDGTLRSFFSKEMTDEFFKPLFTNYKENAPKFVDGMLAPIKDEALKKMIRETMLSAPEHVAVSAMAEMGNEKIWTDDKINVPVLAVMAPSPFWPKDIKEKYEVVAPKMDFQMWTGVSHFLQMEKPKEFNEQVLLFIQKNKLLS